MENQSLSDSPKPGGFRIPFDPDCLIFIIPLGVLITVGLIWHLLWLWIPALLLAACVLTFFRDPERAIPSVPGAVISPADGKVVLIEPNVDAARGPVPGHRIIIFLSVLNVHINRSAYEGTVERIRYQEGKFMNALDPACSDCNECNWIFLRTADGREFTIRQIAGLIARRIVCRVREGQKVRRGERIGLIRFGSRTELYLPGDAEVKVQLGDIVTGGKTIMAMMGKTPAPGE